MVQPQTGVGITSTQTQDSLYYSGSIVEDRSGELLSATLLCLLNANSTTTSWYNRLQGHKIRSHEQGGFLVSTVPFFILFMKQQPTGQRPIYSVPLVLQYRI